LETTLSQSEPFRPARHAGIFWKILVAVGLLSIGAIAVLTWLFSIAYSSLLERQLDERIRSTAVVTANLLANDWPSTPSEEVQAMVRRMGDQAEMRLTLISAEGQVLADSFQTDAAALRNIESHRDRPEFIAAMRAGEGAARRVSPTLSETLRYQAIRVDADGAAVGVVRASFPTAPLAAEIAGLNRWVWSISALLSLAALALAWLIAARLTAPLQELAGAAETLAAGDYTRRIPAAATAKDELTCTALSLNELGKRLAHWQRLLHSTTQTQSTVLEGMTEGVIAVDRHERVLFANAAAGRVLGFDSKRTENLMLLEAVRSHELRAIMQKALRSRQLCKAELAWSGKSLRAFDVLATPLPGDPPPGVVLVLRDITELKRLEHMRQQFVANVSHELKTPLSSIKAYTETLLGGARNDPVHCEKFLQRIDEQASRLHELIMDMLSLARIESAQSPLELASVPVAPAVKRCLADYEPQAAARRVRLETSVSDGEHENIVIRGDEEALRQILSNLVDNAIKYTPAGGAVTVACRLDGAMAVIEVADTGVGIAAEHHGRLFERFYRVDKARSRELGGTGLGLSIVKHLAQAHGGTVAVESQVGHGSRFTVKLPLAAT
jgi:two-component system phosphate regulon sensor histidine kinase PhoR